MERITHRISLDTQKNGIQKILQGFNVGDKVARRIEIALANGGASVTLADTGITALMYVTVSGVASVNTVTIEEGKAIYDVDANDTATAGMVDMNLKILDTTTGMVLYAPRFQLEVWENGIGSSTAATSETFTALESALAQAQLYSQSTIDSIYIDDDNIFTVEYKDGSTYTSSVIADAVSKIGDVEQYVEDAEESATNAATSETNAKTSEDNAKTSETNAKASEDNAKLSETNAKTSETNAKTSEDNAKASETNAKTSETKASASEVNAKTSETNAYDYSQDALSYKNAASASATSASTSATNASTSETNAGTYATNASASATSSANYAKTAESYAVGGTNTRSGEDTDNSKYYMEQCQQIAGGLQGGFTPMGTITFAQLPTSNIGSGWMYNISDEFTSDSRFADGSGKTYAAGSNVYYTANNKWDVLSGAIPTINGKNGNTITLGGEDIAMTNYAKASTWSDVVATDTVNDAIGKLHKGTTNALSSITNTKNDISDLQKKVVFYGTCATSASTSEKAVTVADTNFTLQDGVLLVVHFDNSNSNSSTKLNVNGGGAKNAYAYGGTAIAKGMWMAGEDVIFVYSSSAWNMVGKQSASTSRYGLTITLDGFAANGVGYSTTARSLNSLIKFVNGDTVPSFSSSGTYELGELAYYAGTIYKCKNAVTTAGAFDADDWEEPTSFADRIEALESFALSTTITAGDTTATLTDSRIVADTAKVDVYFKDKVLAPTSVTVTDGQIDIEIPEEETDTDIKILVGRM